MHLYLNEWLAYDRLGLARLGCPSSVPHNLSGDLRKTTLLYLAVTRCDVAGSLELSTRRTLLITQKLIFNIFLLT